MFKEERDELQFSWDMLGDIAVGRPNLGTSMNVSVYRLMQFTLRDVLIRELGPVAADRIYYEAGRSAGRQFFQNLVTERQDFQQFIVELQKLLADLNIGILRVEKADLANLEFVLTVAEDLDCSGLPITNESICTYDEGFINGLFLEFTGREFEVKEVDCWCTGDRVCRFEAKLKA
ncbi:MAG: 4-vinyl reductase [Deltaproteobacteria bacterium]|nr:4-vinyl reductase [Deltaproteobacteria bacterium]